MEKNFWSMTVEDIWPEADNNIYGYKWSMKPLDPAYGDGGTSSVLTTGSERCSHTATKEWGKSIDVGWIVALAFLKPELGCSGRSPEMLPSVTLGSFNQSIFLAIYLPIPFAFVYLFPAL